MRSSDHLISEGIFTKSHSKSSHLSCSVTSFYHHISPFIHFLFPIFESLRDHFGNIIFNFSWSLSYSPEKPPFSIIFRRKFRKGFVLFIYFFSNSIMILMEVLRTCHRTSLMNFEIIIKPILALQLSSMKETCK